ncbi:ATPase AAA [Skermanella stibiiresistens SB22]|uniref:ATPase AAA n=1 Tax=Skermanella stibiiresistens SB22 TaxID=1385369 RepID=W9GYH8_9PROT|nr:type VI secretion system ATPase TssH [Skermanella stibiiresistens]EWY36538.1 ATPase AAA [Skermanella stibiiresistens SB22]
MTIITRDTVFGRLGEFSMKSLQGAFEFATLRGDTYIEPVHWLDRWLRAEDSDASLILERLQVPRDALLKDIEAALSGMVRERSSRLDFSRELELVMERGWISASLLFGQSKIRTGHLLHGMLEDTRLRRLACDISPLLKRVEASAIADRFGDLTKGSSEESIDLPGDAAPVAPAQVASHETALGRYVTDLTAEAEAGRIDPGAGREREIRQIVDILMRRRQNNPMVVGEAGVGKTAVVEALAARIAKGDVPPALRDVRLLSLDLAALQAGASAKGEFENRLKQVIAEIGRSAKPIVLFIDEAHSLIGAGGTAGTGDAANLLKPALARGTLRTIAATTWAEYKKHIEKDPALTRRFQVVQIDEPDEERAVAMLRGMVPVFAEHHGIAVLDEAVVAAVRFSHRYIQGRQLPDKAVSVLDTACARVALSQNAVPAAIEESMRRIDVLDTELTALAAERRVGRLDEAREDLLSAQLVAERSALAGLQARHAEESALVSRIVGLEARLRDRESLEELDHLRGLRVDLAALQGGRPLVLPAVDEQAVATIIESWTGIPVGRMLSDEIDAVLTLADTLKRRVVGQDHALDAIARRLETARAGLGDPSKPKGVFLLVGPSGVGKTETALALAESLFGSDDNVVTINMSEFQEAHTVSTLKGSPPGYVGYGEGGRLTEAVRRKPYSVVLLDEIEKAHPDVHEVFFQVFDKGWMEDGEGRRIDFRNTIILLTSNVGSDLMLRLCEDAMRLPAPEDLSRALRDPLLEVFPAALLGRLSVVPYYPLTDAMLDRIIGLRLDAIRNRIEASRNAPFTYAETLVGHIRARCDEVESGGRMIDAILTGTLLPDISREILRRLRDRQPLTGIHVGVERGELRYEFS